MDSQRIWPALVLWASLTGLLSTSALAATGDNQIRQTMLRLADPDADVRVAAIEELAGMRDGRLAGFMRAYQEGSLYLWRGRLVLCRQIVLDKADKKTAPLSDPLTHQPVLIEGAAAVVPSTELREVSPNTRDRKLVSDTILVLELWSVDPEERLAAVQKCGASRNAEFLTQLADVVRLEQLEKVRRTARESIALIRLVSKVPDQKPEDRLAAARELADLRSARAGPVLQDLLKELDAPNKDRRLVDRTAQKVYQQAIEQIESYQRLVRGFDYLKNGISRGSILILMALGLSIIYGLMRVINMAHGELMMIGAYATYVTQQLFVRYLPESYFNWYFAVSLPVAFLAAAMVGFLIEFLVVRHLYGRPLETLLATWGVSLVLIQAVNRNFGYNIGVNSPTWLRGGVEIFQDMVLPVNRCFIVVLTSFCVLLIYGLMRFTDLGLRIRATMQDREMADALGVNTRRVDGYTFALGAGLAGLAGYALTLIGGVTPDMGQNYIVESFLVVVTGGVGEFAGAIWAGLGLGVLNKILEPSLGAVWGQVLILIGVVLFIQRRPAGLFPPKGRLADV
ncbi:MAG: urea ABC transporter permease subunit UrtB [Planctomycetia bacterium]|nr:urea ABC transporter permease subunit UrtB [Planctomycetia bacterium]